MGSFLFKPQKGEQYKSFIQQGELLTTAELPIIQNVGYGMQLYRINEDSLSIQIATRGVNNNERVYLLIHGTQFSINAMHAQIKDGFASFSFSKNQLKDGINRITVFNEHLKPVCERSYFKFPNNNLSISVTTNKDIYDKKSEAQLNVFSKSIDFEKNSANLSMSVFLLDSIESNHVTQTIESCLLLTNDLAGFVESPSFYFDSTKLSKNERNIALDNLMLTQGWTSYTWKDILGPSIPNTFLPELEGPLVLANITEKKSLKPAFNILTYFSIPGKPFYLATARSNKNGDVLFNLKSDLGAKEAIIQAQPNTSYNFSIIDLYDTRSPFINKRPFDLSKKLYNNLLNRSIASQVENVFENVSYENVPSLNDLDTLSFFGKPTNSYFLDEYTRFTSMEELTREYVKEVKIKTKDNNTSFVLWNNRFQMYNELPPTILFDGVPIFNVNKLFSFDPLKIKNIDIVAQTNLKGSLINNGIVSYHTYKGDLAGFQIDENALLIEYEGAQYNRKFYAPKYSNSSLNSYPDFRNVLLWQPTIALNEDIGKEIQFYTSDIPGKYAILIQGISSDGKLGSFLKYITVK